MDELVIPEFLSGDNQYLSDNAGMELSNNMRSSVDIDEFFATEPYPQGKQDLSSSPSWPSSASAALTLHSPIKDLEEPGTRPSQSQWPTTNRLPNQHREHSNGLFIQTTTGAVNICCTSSKGMIDPESIIYNRLRGVVQRSSRQLHKTYCQPYLDIIYGAAPFRGEQAMWLIERVYAFSGTVGLSLDGTENGKLYHRLVKCLRIGFWSFEIATRIMRECPVSMIDASYASLLDLIRNDAKTFGEFYAAKAQAEGTGMSDLDREIFEKWLQCMKQDQSPT